MPRYRLTIEYDGTPFVGWQRQDNGPSVQGAIETALFKLSGEQTLVQGAGRTDTGVHALGQVAHCDLARDFPADRIRDGLNAHLRPDPVAIIAAVQVDGEFHARFSAARRHYLYRIVNRRAPLALDHDRAWLVQVPLDAGEMHEAAQGLVGRHDFTTFRASQCQAASPVRTLDRISVERTGAEIVVRCDALSFLHNQVRSIVGSLKLVGEGKWTRGDLATALRACDRARCGPVAPPEGLYLAQVDYPG